LTSILETILVLLWKDFTVEARRALELVTTLLFSLIVASFVGFSVSKFSPDRFMGLVIGGTGIVLTQAFIAIFVAIMSFVREADRGTLIGLKLAPVTPVTLYVSKLIFTLILVEVFTVIAYGALIYFGGYTLEPMRGSLAILLASGLYLSVVSAFTSALSIHLEAKLALIPTLILALSAPLMQSTVTLIVMQNVKLAGLLTISSLVFAMITTWLSEYILE
jgi:heme exporter protein B